MVFLLPIITRATYTYTLKECLLDLTNTVPHTTKGSNMRPMAAHGKMSNRLLIVLGKVSIW